MRTKYIAISIGTCGLLLFCARVMRNIQPIPTPQFSQLALRAHAPLPIYPQTCNEEATHIYFLKIHKAGSTTVQNIFLRYGFTRNLSTLVFLHAKYSYPHRKFTHMLPMKSPGYRYDMYYEHSIYDESMLMRILHKDTLNIAVIREPFSRLQSAFKSFKLAGHMKLEESPDMLNKFLERPETYLARSSFARDMTQNMMAREFGFTSENNMTEYLAYIESKFMVLVMENLTESLVLMRRMLCWQVKDILYFQMRKRTSKPIAENPRLIALNKKFSSWDYAFYEHFTKVLHNKLEQQPEDFFQEVHLVEEYLVYSSEFCDKVCRRLSKEINKTNANRKYMVTILEDHVEFDTTKFHDNFSVFGYECLMMKFDPEIYREASRVRFFPKTFCSSNAEKHYCKDYFKYNFPWHILRDKDTFLSTCL